MVDSVPQFTPDRAAAQTARAIALQMIEQRGRGALLVVAARVDAARERLLQAVSQQTSGPEGQPVDPALRDYILLITILVAFLEAAAQQLRPQPPAVVMGFGGIQSPRQEPDERA